MVHLHAAILHANISFQGAVYVWFDIFCQPKLKIIDFNLEISGVSRAAYCSIKINLPSRNVSLTFLMNLTTHELTRHDHKLLHKT